MSTEAACPDKSAISGSAALKSLIGACPFSSPRGSSNSNAPGLRHTKPVVDVVLKRTSGGCPACRKVSLYLVLMCTHF